MTQTCTDCHDATCIHMGRDERACDHHVRLSDLDPQPVVDTPSSSSQGLVNDEVDARLRNLERMLHDIARVIRGELP